MTSSGDPRRDLEAAKNAKLVHEARKAIKRMRALARLLRGEMGDEQFHRVNSLLRESGRRLAASRDAEVRLATLSRLTTRHPKALALEGIGRLRAQLEAERAQADVPAHGSTSRRQALDDVADMRRELSRWNLLDTDFRALAPGLRRIYREGRLRYERVERQRARPKDLHDWRKRVKALYYALEMLGGANAKGTRRQTSRAEHLGEMLGEEHDLWMLALYVQEHPRALGEDDRAAETLAELIEKRRERLRERALAAGARVYADPPDEFTRRVGKAICR
ncbi:MAG TPA: CHAD domain-containing protein [Solirubrobacteraceae bacterium]|jgi:CHAD domain-containing protein